MDTKDFKFTIKTVTEDRAFEGYLATYNTVDLGGDRVMPGAFKKTLIENGGVVPLLWQHDPASPIGRLELSESQRGLKVKGRLVEGVQRSNEAYQLLKAEIVKGLSIGYETIKSKMVEGVRNLIEVKLYEGSLVLFPMNQHATVTAVKNKLDLSPLDDLVRDVRELF